MLVKNELYAQMGKRIKTARRACGMTQGTLAEKVGVTNQHISNVELGVKAPSYDLLYAVADALGCCVYSLLPASTAPDGAFFAEDTAQLLQQASPYQQRMVTAYIQWYLAQPLPPGAV